MPFTIQLRADLISERMAQALRAAGCKEVWIGAESGSQKILDAMNKGTRVTDIVEARRLLRAEGIRVGFFLQLGYLGEELDDILATRDLVARDAPRRRRHQCVVSAAGHEVLRARERASSATSRHWQDSDDLDMMFFGTYRKRVLDRLAARPAARARVA